MKKAVFFFWLMSPLFVQAQFAKHFYDKTLRIDYVHAGNDSSDYYAMDELIQEGVWAGSKTNLVDAFDYGNYKVVVRDKKGSEVLYSKGFSTLFWEWQTTAEARITTRAFAENVLIPFPRYPVTVEFHNRLHNGQWQKKFTCDIDPENYFIRKENRLQFPVLSLHQSGQPAVSLDLVIIPEGYTAGEMEKFKADSRRFADYLLDHEVYKPYANNINITAVLAPSLESGADIPGKGVWKQTVLNSTFYTFDSDRYLTTSDMKSVRDVAANVPYDQILIVANTSVYGGGGIYNFYGLFTSDNPFAREVFIHEFGHSFAGLADEYYDSEVSYEGFYDLSVEPWEPNITTLVDFKYKWADLVTPETEIPTRSKLNNKNIVGAFEGGGYLAKGIYRPSVECMMKSFSSGKFCPVCTRAIHQMIENYIQ
ncbi:MAG: M64 family metallopeptidase [Lentimicrobiaceae bacterium]|nr:M64 family metallopeptidase [Lentimicrobiaceae bacterium]